MRAIFFGAGSLALLWLSRLSLKRPGSHGFYRFFAWECILALCVLNFRGFSEWFRDPFSARQVMSWILLFVSIVPVTWGAHLLHAHGHPAPGDERPLFEFEKTTQLVTAGVFTYIRHPLYSSLLLLAWGVFAKRPARLSLALAAAASAFLFATAKAEEAENRTYFGPQYDDYMRRSKMFIPFVI